jgi:O-Antigen ligase
MTFTPSLGAAVGFLTVTGFGFAHGGYFPRSWGIGVVLLAVAVVLGLHRNEPIGRLEWAFALGTLALVGVAAVSLTWTASVTLTMLEVERAALYATFVTALVLIADRAAELLRGLLAATALLAAWALVEHLLLDRDVDAFQGALLTGTVEYANALAALAAIGAVAAASLGANRRAGWPYMVVGQLLFCTVALTNSRGAIVALAAGAAVATALARARLRLALLLAFAALSALVVGYVGAVTGVTRGQVPSSEVVWEARAVLLLALFTAAGAGVFAKVLPDRPRRTPRRVLYAALVPLTAAALLALVFASPGLGDRREYWRVAAGALHDHPILGHGPGTFERLWLERRPVEREARDAHSLYLEVLAEQGIVGGLLLVVVLGVPVIAVVRSGRGAVRAAAGGAYATYLLHAGLDWDWEMPAVTAAGLLAGVAAVKLGRRQAEWEISRGALALTAGALAVVVAGSVFALVGNWHIQQARDALEDGRPAAAFSSATRAASLQPWSSEPLLLDAQSRLALGDPRGARKQLVQAVARDPTLWLGWWLLALSSERAAERVLAARESARLNPLFQPRVRP